MTTNSSTNVNARAFGQAGFGMEEPPRGIGSKCSDFRKNRRLLTARPFAIGAIFNRIIQLLSIRKAPSFNQACNTIKPQSAEASSALVLAFVRQVRKKSFAARLTSSKGREVPTLVVTNNLHSTGQSIFYKSTLLVHKFVLVNPGAVY
jgi:hypothetical protein